jgi:hypothetical protein
VWDAGDHDYAFETDEARAGAIVMTDGLAEVAS